MLGDGNQHTARVSVEAFFARIVADLIDNFADEFIVVEDRVGGDLTEQHHIAGLDGCLTGDARARVLLKTGIQHGIGDLIADLIGVSFRNRF